MLAVKVSALDENKCKNKKINKKLSIFETQISVDDY